MQVTSLLACLFFTLIVTESQGCIGTISGGAGGSSGGSAGGGTGGDSGGGSNSLLNQEKCLKFDVQYQDPSAAARKKRSPIPSLDHTRVKRQSAAAVAIADAINTGISDGSITDLVNIEQLLVAAYLTPSDPLHASVTSVPLSQAVQLATEVFPLIPGADTIPDRTNLRVRFGLPPLPENAEVGSGIIGTDITPVGNTAAEKYGFFYNTLITRGDITSFEDLTVDAALAVLNSQHPLHSDLVGLSADDLTKILNEALDGALISPTNLAKLSDPSNVLESLGVKAQVDQLIGLGTGNTVNIDTSNRELAQLAIEQVILSEGLTTAAEVQAFFDSAIAGGRITGITSKEVSDLFIEVINSGSTAATGLTDTESFKALVSNNALAFLDGVSTSDTTGFLAKVTEYINSESITDITALSDKLETLRASGAFGEMTAFDLKNLIVQAAGEGSGNVLAGLTGSSEFIASVEASTAALTNGNGLVADDVTGAAANIEAFLASQSGEFTDVDSLVATLESLRASGSLGSITADELTRLVADVIRSGGSAALNALSGSAEFAAITIPAVTSLDGGLDASNVADATAKIEAFISENSITNADDLLRALKSATASGEFGSFTEEQLKELIKATFESGSSTVISGLSGVQTLVDSVINKDALSQGSLAVTDIATSITTIEAFISDNQITDGATLLAQLAAATESGIFGELSMEEVREIIALAVKDGSSTVLSSLSGISEVTASAVFTSTLTAENAAFSISMVPRSRSTINQFILANTFSSAEAVWDGLVNAMSRGKITISRAEMQRLFIAVGRDSSSELSKFSDISTFMESLSAKLFAGDAEGLARRCMSWESGRGADTGIGGSWKGEYWVRDGTTFIAP